jgi:hypothetical protein
MIEGGIKQGERDKEEVEVGIQGNTEREMEEVIREGLRGGRLGEDRWGHRGSRNI